MRYKHIKYTAGERTGKAKEHGSIPARAAVHSYTHQKIIIVRLYALVGRPFTALSKENYIQHRTALSRLERQVQVSGFGRIITNYRVRNLQPIHQN